MINFELTVILKPMTTCREVDSRTNEVLVLITLAQFCHMIFSTCFISPLSSLLFHRSSLPRLAALSWHSFSLSHSHPLPFAGNHFISLPSLIQILFYFPKNGPFLPCLINLLQQCCKRSHLSKQAPMSQLIVLCPSHPIDISASSIVNEARFRKLLESNGSMTPHL